MKYISTRGRSEPVYFSSALEKGLAPDGGLYVPKVFPHFNLGKRSSSQQAPTPYELPTIAYDVIAPWLEGDALQKNLRKICKNTFSFPAPLQFLEDHIAVLELFHGPTAAFKDFGARFLSECVTQLLGHSLAHSRPERSSSPTVLVATSGDTGGAVAAAFFRKKGIEVVVLFPKGKISLRQEKLLTCWGENVRAIAVQGTFDDCQRIVKQGFTDTQWQNEHPLLSANSINLGRLLPQSVYYASGSLAYFDRHQIAPGIIIPTGNLGNAVAALWAKQMGFPIREVVLATNANRPIPDFLETGVWKAHPTVATLANAMDVGNPSNIERLQHLFPGISKLRETVCAVSTSDRQISETIQFSKKKWNQVFCPHTATAVHALQELQNQRGSKDPSQDHWIIVATAHPAKFEKIVEPLIGQRIEVPRELEWALARPQCLAGEITADWNELKSLLENDLGH